MQDPLERFYRVHPTASPERLQKILEAVFPDAPEQQRSFRQPWAFNHLLDWVTGDAQWPIAALLMHSGVAGDEPRTYKEIAVIVGRAATNVATKASLVNQHGLSGKLRQAPSLMGPTVMRNELRGVLGLQSKVWEALAREGVRTIAQVRRRMIHGHFQPRVINIGESTEALIAAKLAS